MEQCVTEFYVIQLTHHQCFLDSFSCT